MLVTSLHGPVEQSLFSAGLSHIFFGMTLDVIFFICSFYPIPSAFSNTINAIKLSHNSSIRGLLAIRMSEWGKYISKLKYITFCVHVIGSDPDLNIFVLIRISEDDGQSDNQSTLPLFELQSASSSPWSN